MNTSNKFSFRKYIHDDVFHYDLILDDQVIKEHWVKLYDYDEWDRISEEVLSRRNFSITPATGEDIVLLPAIAWAITKGCKRFSTNTLECASAIKWIKRPGDFSSLWVYEIFSQYDHKFPEIISGCFQKITGNKKCPIWEIFEVDDLFALQAAGLGDVKTSVNLYAINEHKSVELFTCLSSPHLSVPQIVDCADIFIAFTYGFDIGYCNGIKVVSKICIDDIVKEVEYDFAARVSDYEESVKSVQSVDDWFLAINRLLKE